MANPAGSDVSEATLDRKDYIDFYKVYRDYIMQESGLINLRLIWIITINGFLFTTYGFTLQKELEIMRAVVIKKADAANPTTIFYATLSQVEIFLITISIVGVLVGVFGRIAIKTAQNASDAATEVFRNSTAHVIRKMSRGRKPAIDVCATRDEYEFPFLRGGGLVNSVTWAHFAAREITTLMSLIWVILLFVTIFVWFYNYRLL